MSSALVAIAVIVAGIVVLNLLHRVPDTRVTSDGAPQPAAASVPGSPRPVTSAAPSAPSDHTPAATNSPPAKQHKKPTATQPPRVAARAPLTVLNHSRRELLARRAADGFAANGWPIHLIGNTTYQARMTTVYYVPGQEGAARRLMREFPGIRRMLLRPRGLPGSGLTVVVTKHYPA